jgi:superfamily II DNA or RNA helicase
VIACAEDLSQHIALPRGCEEGLARLLDELGIALESEDRRSTGEPLDYDFQGTLTQFQELAAKALLRHDIGVCVAPPGLGKTVLGTYLVARRGTNTLILVHRQPLLDQWRAQLSLFLGLEPGAIGQFGAGKHKANGKLDVAMIQSLVRKGQVTDCVAAYGQVIVDECHHVPAVSFERVLSEVKARYVVGLTATPERRDGHDPIIEMQLGPIRFAADAKREAGRREFDHRLIVRETCFELPPEAADSAIQALYAALADDQYRNQMIAEDVAQALQQGRSPLVLTERRDHLERLAAQLRDVARHLVVLHGGGGVRERRAIRDQLAAIPEGESRLLLATGRYAGEGFDDARLDTLFLAMPVSWKGTLVQYTGRLHRRHAGKRNVFIFDYVDRRVPVLARMFEKRLRGYRAIGYDMDEAPRACTAGRKRRSDGEDNPTRIYPKAQ